MNTLEITAVHENLPQVLRFIDEGLALGGCDGRTKTQIDVAAEEIFINISSYAYGDAAGPAQIQMELKESPAAAVIRFCDCGKRYDPLEKPDPNLKIPIRERKKGGMGIYLVKKSMDEVFYEYRDGKNILTIVKNIG